MTPSFGLVGIGTPARLPQTWCWLGRRYVSGEANGGATPRKGGARQAHLAGEAEQHYVAVLNDVFLPLRTCEALLPRRLPSPNSDEVTVSHRLGAYEALLEVGVDDPGRHRCLVPTMNGPGAYFL